MQTSISPPPSGPALAQGSELGVPLTLATLLDAFQFSTEYQGLNVPLVANGTVRSLPIEASNSNSGFAATYGMLKRLFDGKGAMRPRPIEANQPWYVERRKVLEGNELSFFKGRFGQRITLTPMRDDIHVTLEQRQRFATVAEVFHFDPVALQVTFYRKSFLAQLHTNQLIPPHSQFKDLIQTVSDMQKGGEIAKAYIEQDVFTWAHTAVSPSAELSVHSASLSTHLIQGALQYVPGQKPDMDGLDGLVLKRWNDVHGAAQLDTPPAPFPQGNDAPSQSDPDAEWEGSPMYENEVLSEVLSEMAPRTMLQRPVASVARVGR